MNKSLIALTSITYAIKAKKYLNNLGYYCEIERTQKDFSTGCGYSIKVMNDPKKIIEMLEKNEIKCKAYREL